MHVHILPRFFLNIFKFERGANFLPITLPALLLIFTQEFVWAADDPTIAQQPNDIASAYSPTQSGPNHRVWQSVAVQTNSAGREIYRTNSFTELASGMNYQAGGVWLEASDKFEIVQGVAEATNAQHQLYLAGNLNSPEAVHLVTPDGFHLKSQPLCIAYYDGVSNVSIGQIQDTTGQLLPSYSEALYTNAFSGGFINADVHYVFKKSGLSQDIIFRTQLPDPGRFGLNPAKTYLQIWTRFAEAPEPEVRTQANRYSGIPDDNLSFGIMQMGRGKAFQFGDDSDIIPVYKQWTVVNGVNFLIEQVPLVQILPLIQTLPLAPGGGPSNTPPTSGGAQSSVRIAEPRIAKATSRTPLKTLPFGLGVATAHPGKKIPFGLARYAAKNQGFVLDYNFNNGSMTNFIFQSDTTYYVTNEVDFYGSNIFEGGTVIKFSPSSFTNHVQGHSGPKETTSASLVFMDANPIWQAGPYRPVVFTSKDDNSIGSTISGSTGSPGTNFYGHLALDLSAISNPSVLNARFSYLYNPMFGADLIIRDVQAINCSILFNAGDAFTRGDNYKLQNCLLSQIGIVADSADNDGHTLVSQNVTAHMCGTLIVDSTSDTYVTNCIFLNLTNWHTLGSSTNSSTIVSNVAVFQTMGAASYYLPFGSFCIHAGNTNIDSTLLKDLRQKTTQAPTVYAYQTISNNLTLSPQNRDAGPYLDQGYHYDPLDYAFGSVEFLGNATLIINPGTTIGCFATNNLYGILVGPNSQLISAGGPAALNRIVEYNTVQEQSTTNWANPAYSLIVPNFVNTNAFAINCRFTDFSIMAQDTDHLSGASDTYPIDFQDCQFHGGSICKHASGDQGFNFTNCLFERVYTSITVDGSGIPTQNTIFRNNLFWGGYFEFYFASTNSLVQNNMFFKTSVADDTSTPYICGYNAFYSTSNTFLTYTNATDKFLTVDPGYQVGALGSFYLPSTNASLLHVGSTNANVLGLYQYTMTTNQVKEATSIVSIGYHYVAVDSTGQPIDTNNDAIPDYLADANGNGLNDGTETDWMVMLTDPNSIGPTGLTVYTPLK